MQDQPKTRRVPVGMIAGLSALAVTAGSATAFVAWQTATKPRPIERCPAPGRPNSADSKISAQSCACC